MSDVTDVSDISTEESAPYDTSDAATCTSETDKTGLAIEQQNLLLIYLTTVAVQQTISHIEDHVTLYDKCTIAVCNFITRIRKNPLSALFVITVITNRLFYVFNDPCQPP